jgi:hypothetical protein
MAMTLEEEILNKAGAELAREVDREVLWSMLVGIGWTRVLISLETSMVHATDIKEWLDSNTTGSYEKHRSDFMFENDKDAMLFILKWQ